MAKHIPILFSTAMVQAILEGRKTQTRRILKVKGCKPFAPDNSWTYEDIMRWNKDYHPYGQPGDVLWVREKFAPPSGNQKDDAYMYAADYLLTAVKHAKGLWKPSIHMPKKACRIFLKVISVRVERLQDISEQDAIAEGVKLHHRGKHYLNYDDEHYKVTQFIYNLDTAVESYKSLWRLINGRDSWNKSTWDNNPWVWVVEFERCMKPENFDVK